MLKKLYYILMNGLFLLLIYAATVLEITGAINLLIFVCWLMLVLAILILIASANIEEYGDKLKKSGYTFNSRVDITFDFIITFILVWFGFFWSASAYLIGCLIIYGLKLEDKKDD